MDLQNDLASLLLQLWSFTSHDNAKELIDEAGLRDGKVDHRDLGRGLRGEVRVLQTRGYLQKDKKTLKQNTVTVRNPENRNHLSTE